MSSNAAMDKIKSTSRRISIKARTLIYSLRIQKKQSSCRMFAFSPTIVSLILDHLPVPYRLILAQTCRFLRHTIHHELPRSQPLQREDFVLYLTCLARDLPTRWVCDYCLKLHPVIETDIPRNTQQTTCPKALEAKSTRYFPSYHSWSCQFYHRPYALGHRHIAMTLKYARLNHDGKLNKRQQQHLRSLLEPFVFTLYASPQLRPMGIVYIGFWPRIIQGRYLVHSRYIYDDAKLRVPISVDTMGSLSICPHQTLGSEVSVFQPDPYRRSMNRVEVLIEHGLRSQHEGILRECCGWCLTDFTLLFRPKRLEIFVWSDLGPESSVYEPAWELQAYPRSFRGSKSRPLVHEMGSIQRAYYSEGETEAIRNRPTRTTRVVHDLDRGPR